MNTESISKKLVRFIVYTILVAFVWDVTYIGNMHIFSNLRQTHYITWIFIPAGVRLVSVLLLDGVAISGLFVGAMITNHMFNEIDLPTAIVISLISAISPYIAIELSKYFLKVNDMLSNLHAKELVVMSLTMSVVTAFSHNAYFYSNHMYNKILLDVFGMFVGDFFGCLIVLYALALTLSWMKYSYAKNKNIT